MSARLEPSALRSTSGQLLELGVSVQALARCRQLPAPGVAAASEADEAYGADLTSIPPSRRPDSLRWQIQVDRQPAIDLDPPWFHAAGIGIGLDAPAGCIAQCLAEGRV